MLVLALLIWFVGPLLAVADSKFWAPAASRLVSISLLFLAWGLFIVFISWRANVRKKAEADDVDAQERLRREGLISEEQVELRGRFKQALRTLKTSSLYRGRSEKWRNELPWYLLLGAEGSGKTTLLGLLAGLDLPSRGRISLAGNDLAALDEEARAQLRAREVGFVFQSFHLLPALTAAENVALPLELAGREDRARVDEVLAQVGLAHRARHYPRQLSGGEQQRVALARAFVTRPRILFADEPTGSLDHATGQHISDLLFELNASSGTTLVLVTHDLRLAQRCQYIHRIDDGRLLPVERGAQA